MLACTSMDCRVPGEEIPFGIKPSMSTCRSGMIVSVCALATRHTHAGHHAWMHPRPGAVRQCWQCQTSPCALQRHAGAYPAGTRRGRAS